MWRKLNLHDAMSTFISLILLSGALYVILSGDYDEGTRNWAYGIIGALVATWLRSERLTQTTKNSSQQRKKKLPIIKDQQEDD